MSEMAESSLEKAIGNLANLYVEAFYQYSFLAELFGRDQHLQNLARRNENNSAKAKNKANYILNYMHLMNIPFRLKQLAPFDPMKLNDLRDRIRSAIDDLNGLTKEDSNLRDLLSRSMTKMQSADSSPRIVSEKKIRIRSEEYSINYDSDSAPTSKRPLERNEQSHEMLEGEDPRVTFEELSSESLSEQTTCNNEDSQKATMQTSSNEINDSSKNSTKTPNEDSLSQESAGGSEVTDVGPKTVPVKDPLEPSDTNEDVNDVSKSSSPSPGEDGSPGGSQVLDDVDPMTAPVLDPVEPSDASEGKNSTKSNGTKPEEGSQPSTTAEGASNDIKVAVTQKSDERDSHRVRIDFVVEISLSDGLEIKPRLK